MPRRPPLLQFPLRRAQPADALLLALAEPRLLRLAQHALAEIIHKVAEHDQGEGQRVQPVDVQAEDAQADDDAPEVAGEQGDVEEGGAGEAVQDGYEGVEEREDERVAREVAADFAVPGRGAEARAVEDARLHAVDDHAPEAELADHFVEGLRGDEVLLGDIAETVECGAEEGEEVAFELVAGGDVAAVGASDVVASQEEAHARDTDEDSEYLGPVIANAEEEEGDYDNDDDSPKVD